jgi:hypothetical protein
MHHIPEDRNVCIPSYTSTTKFQDLYGPGQKKKKKATDELLCEKEGYLSNMALTPSKFGIKSYKLLHLDQAVTVITYTGIHIFESTLISAKHLLLCCHLWSK